MKNSLTSPPWGNIRGFTSPGGRLEKSGRGVTTFVPSFLPPQVTYDREMVGLLVMAERKVGELKGMGDGLKNPRALIRACLKREAALSSRIEGVPASTRDLNMYEAAGGRGMPVPEGVRLAELRNCVRALEESLEKAGRPLVQIGLDSIKDAHSALMEGVRGGDRNPGQLRTGQCWIARAGSRSATYIPPAPEKLPALLDDLVEFVQKDHVMLTPLIQCAVAHYQFEAIHPFADGNGRIGRLLILLMLYKKSLLPKPLICMSAFFERNREDYYRMLLRVSQKGSWNEWIKFFMNALITQAGEAIDTIRKLDGIEAEYREALHGRNATSNVLRLMESLFENPFVTVSGAKRLLGVAYPTAKSAVAALEEAGILERVGAHGTKMFRAGKIDALLAA